MLSMNEWRWISPKCGVGIGAALLSRILLGGHKEDSLACCAFRVWDRQRVWQSLLATASIMGSRFYVVSALFSTFQSLTLHHSLEPQMTLVLISTAMTPAYLSLNHLLVQLS